uniref:Uncharacterized protein n=1 Tax=Pleurozia purpurea TaxID=280637 RepID=D0R060_9MARC|nr:hypothetical protein PlpuMp61 [Pleurozia purpurea]ACR19397.1 hypothetical protein PlpuMp61 [Pleurozia purpurea]
MYSNLKSSSKPLIYKDLAEEIVTNAYCYSINKVKDFSSQFEEAHDKPTDYSKVTWEDNEADWCNDRPMKNILEVFGSLASEYVRNDSNSKLSKYGKYFVGV